jgi:methylase of polypeptide subunit release factors
MQRRAESYPRQVFNDDFFAVAREYVTGCAISNPPYLPARDNKIIMPELWGGPDGSRVTGKTH